MRCKIVIMLYVIYASLHVIGNKCIKTAFKAEHELVQISFFWHIIVTIEKWGGERGTSNVIQLRDTFNPSEWWLLKESVEFGVGLPTLQPHSFQKEHIFFRCVFLTNFQSNDNTREKHIGRNRDCS